MEYLNDDLKSYDNGCSTFSPAFWLCFLVLVDDEARDERELVSDDACLDRGAEVRGKEREKEWSKTVALVSFE